VVLAEFHFSDDPRTVLIRGDIDAVNVKETLSLTYASFREDVSHKCGHDGHIVILLEVARELSEMHLPFGRVLLFFHGRRRVGTRCMQIIATIYTLSI
jgi:metal-dependent amidase/aminoacylase/carboxypeptidase family protein